MTPTPTPEAVVTPPAPEPGGPTIEPLPVPAKPAPELPTFTWGVQGFLRPTTRINPWFSKDGPDPAADIPQRIRLQLLGKYKWLSVFAQVQDTRRWGFETNTAASTNNTDLHQGYMEFGGAFQEKKFKGYLRIGRQEIDWGNQRLIGSLGWFPEARSFDAIRGRVELGRFGLDAWFSPLSLKQNFCLNAMGGVVPCSDPASVAQYENNGTQLYAAQLFANVHAMFGAELFYLGLNARPVGPAVGAELGLAPPSNMPRGLARRKISNFGLRLFGKGKRLAYDVEANLQTGENEGQEHSAWALAAFVSYTIDKAKIKPQFRIGYNAASGDPCKNQTVAANCGGGDKSLEFFNFYPTNHIHYGYMDLFAWQNMRELDARFQIVPAKVLEIVAAYHFFQMMEPTGAWRNAPSGTIQGGRTNPNPTVAQRYNPTNDEHTLGHEIDIIANVKAWEGKVFFQPGYGVFIPTQAGTTIGGPDPQHFLWIWMTFTLGS